MHGAIPTGRRRLGEPTTAPPQPTRPASGAATCALCGARARRLLVTGYDRLVARPGRYPYWRCASCGLVARSPMPAAAEIEHLYPSDYHARIETWTRNLDKPVNRLAVACFYGVDSVATPRPVRALFRALSGRILRGLVEPHGDNRLLDVGCGGGNTLAVYQRLGWDAHGIEPHPDAAARCRASGLLVHEGTVFDAPFGAEFDVVLLSHVIEHVLEPIAVLRRASEFLAPGGRMILLTPNARALGFAVYRSCWFALDAPRHLFLFDPHTIRLLGRTAGLMVRRVSTPSTPQILCESRHYAATQGQALPEDLAQRAAIVERSWRHRPRYRLYRELVTPLAALAARVGRGDVLEAELTVGVPS
jgi:2-polyprenyl-3-methyl-5-hydroxy-6-metoxy-1,4-benzoquinol methylase